MSDHTNLSEFVSRHIGPDENDINHMLGILGEPDLDTLVKQVVPESILKADALQLNAGVSEHEALAELRAIASENAVMTSLIGQGYSDCLLPEVIKRNVLESPGWYTAYTPYQPEIAQGRLEVLFNFQTLITELTGMSMANASLLDESTAAAEAMSLCHRALRGKREVIRVSQHVHPQTIDVLQTRAEPLGIEVIVCADSELTSDTDACFAVLVQYPGTTGEVVDYRQLSETVHGAGGMMIFAADILALTLLATPASMGADVVVGSAQRFGVPMGFGGPHAAFMATTDKHKRSLPGRLIGQSIDASGNPAYRLALQTREQHIRREKATSNICTAQALLAIIATLYACYHGPTGLRQIATRVHLLCQRLRATLEQHGMSVVTTLSFDTLAVSCDATAVLAAAADQGINVRLIDDGTVCIAVDEVTAETDLCTVAAIIIGQSVDALSQSDSALPSDLLRDDDYMTQRCFHDYYSETEMMRYLRKLSDRDIALDRAMIPLGSCTMKLNAAAEMAPVSWPEFARIHPFAPNDQTRGYQHMITQLETMLCACTGYDAMSLQPNAGSQGEYAGLLAIRRYHESRGESQRHVCLIPASAHGTNPASAQMAGMKVVVVKCDDAGNVDLADLQEKLDLHADQVAAIMITYPSTHGVFEAQVRDICQRVHDAGGQVYIDGANLNAMVGLAEPGQFGGDVSHLNLHKTFCIPHGGGGPGVGPIGVGKHLAGFVPGHREWGDARGAVSAAPWGSALILPITWMYIRMMGASGLKRATEVAIVNANYIAHRLSEAYPILYRGDNGYIAHECIIDTRGIKETTGVTVDDIAKRLIDYGFHAPTMSFPVAGTLMIEPTESESLAEIDRFIDAMLSIKSEIDAVESGDIRLEESVLVHAPHTAAVLLSDDWHSAYTREQAAFPTERQRDDTKYWPPVGRIDNVHGDKNLICSCPPLSSYGT